MRIREIIAGLSVALLGSAANATVIYTLEDPGVHSTQIADVITVDFNDGSCGSLQCTGAGQIVSGSSSGVYATPFGISDRYLTVGNGSASLFLDGGYNYYGLYWGSADNYNFLSFFLNGVLVGSFGGDQLGPLMASGNQTSYSSNRYVNFFFTNGSRYDSVTLTSNGYAFESDNHAYGHTITVPEPSTLLLLAGALPLPLLWRRRRALARAQA